MYFGTDTAVWSYCSPEVVVYPRISDKKDMFGFHLDVRVYGGQGVRGFIGGIAYWKVLTQ